MSAPDADLDLVVIYPDGLHRRARGVRNSLFSFLRAVGVVADIVLLSEREESKATFWKSESVKELGAICQQILP